MSAPKDQVLSKHIGAVSANKITLAVQPDAAEALSEAAEVGKIRLVLRNRLSRAQQHLSGIQPDDLLPASAFEKEKSVESVHAKVVTKEPVPLPPPIMGNEPQNPLDWVVQLIMGDKKEQLSVPPQ
jgi:Flp pilus assembly protein CpaB